MVYLVGGLCVVNVILWIIFFVKFNKRFSTQKIIEQTRIEMNELVKDMQRNTAGNIDLINGAIDRLKRVNAEAEQKINQLNKKLELVNADIATKKGAEQLHSEIASKVDTIAQKKQSAVYPPINSTKMANQVYRVNNPQRDLFDEEPIEIKDDTVVTQDGAAYREVPVISTKVLDEMSLSKPKEKSLSEKVMELHNAGKLIDEIATELSVSTTEVQFIIDVS